MKTELKQQIVQAMEQYMLQHKMSQTDMAERAAVNPAYLINLRKGDFTIKSGGKTINVADKYFKRIADSIGYSTEKAYWPVRETEQLKSILNSLNDAKASSEMTVIIGETGCGKTYTCDLFTKKFPKEVFKVTVGESDNLSDLIDKAISAIGIDTTIRSKSARLQLIKRHMRKLNEEGLEPTLLWDESEYMKQPALCAQKELYDVLDGWCANILIGTPQLLLNIEKLKRKNKPGIPQLFRRIRYRIRPLPTIDRSFKLFIKDLEPGLRKWCQKNCDNYGELRDVLVPAMKEAEREGVELTEDYVKMILGLV
jgi:DNA transposition AAA+ family ATPase